jgi:hypothetical protein
MSQCVVVLRLENDNEVIGILVGENDSIVKLEHPYAVYIDNVQQTVAMMPYCTLTDETFFEFKKSKLQFLVTASTPISNKFIKMIESVSETQEDIFEDETEQYITQSDDIVYIEGNSTKH